MLRGSPSGSEALFNTLPDIALFFSVIIDSDTSLGVRFATGFGLVLLVLPDKFRDFTVMLGMENEPWLLIVMIFAGK